MEFEEDNVQPPVGVFLPLLSFEVQKCKKTCKKGVEFEEDEVQPAVGVFLPLPPSFRLRPAIVPTIVLHLFQSYI